MLVWQHSSMLSFCMFICLYNYFSVISLICIRMIPLCLHIHNSICTCYTASLSANTQLPLSLYHFLPLPLLSFLFLPVYKPTCTCSHVLIHALDRFRFIRQQLSIVMYFGLLHFIFWRIMMRGRGSVRRAMLMNEIINRIKI